MYFFIFSLAVSHWDYKFKANTKLISMKNRQIYSLTQIAKSNAHTPLAFYIRHLTLVLYLYAQCVCCTSINKLFLNPLYIFCTHLFFYLRQMFKGITIILDRSNIFPLLVILIRNSKQGFQAFNKTPLYDFNHMPAAFPNYKSFRTILWHHTHS